MTFINLLLLFTSSCLLVKSVFTYNVTATAEAPHVQSPTAQFEYIKCEQCVGLQPGLYASVITNFGQVGGGLQGEYTHYRVYRADIWGGAGGTGYYPTVDSGESSTLKLTQVGAQGVNYFGLWISGLDEFSVLELYLDDTLLSRWGTQDILRLVQGNPAYFGNPNNPAATATHGYAFVYVNFYSYDSLINKIVFIQKPGNGKFETDAHCAGTFLTQTGTPIEPETTTTAAPPTTTAPPTTAAPPPTTAAPPPTTAAPPPTTAAPPPTTAAPPVTAPTAAPPTGPTTASTTTTTTAEVGAPVGVIAGAAAAGVAILAAAGLGAYMMSGAQGSAEAMSGEFDVEDLRSEESMDKELATQALEEAFA